MPLLCTFFVTLEASGLGFAQLVVTFHVHGMGACTIGCDLSRHCKVVIAGRPAVSMGAPLNYRTH